MPEVSWLAVLLCGVATLLIGGLWYSPLLFGRAWQRETGLSDDVLASGSMATRFGLTFLLGLIAGAVFAMFIGTAMTVAQATAAGAAAGIAWVAASFGINYLFERRSLKLWLINGGYHAVQFTTFGAIIGALQWTPVP
ncbi:DUF1761 domain-containing protein [Sphingoaurantiacus capsulatus]|uniref:DUF1761 domain-containing protein n=1 Tax=Sphingoaurantiacus capsulatus TaxID=1771310 RepID=A0ABV7XDF9_9SPHN